MDLSREKWILLSACSHSCHSFLFFLHWFCISPVLPCCLQKYVNLWPLNYPVVTISKLEPAWEREQKVFCNLYFRKEVMDCKKETVSGFLTDTCPGWDDILGEGNRGDLGGSQTWACVQENHPESLLKHRILPPKVSDSIAVKPKFHMSSRFPGNADATCLRTRFEH